MTWFVSNFFVQRALVFAFNFNFQFGIFTLPGGLKSELQLAGRPVDT